MILLKSERIKNLKKLLVQDDNLIVNAVFSFSGESIWKKLSKGSKPFDISWFFVLTFYSVSFKINLYTNNENWTCKYSDFAQRQSQ